MNSPRDCGINNTQLPLSLHSVSVVSCGEVGLLATGQAHSREDWGKGGRGLKDEALGAEGLRLVSLPLCCVALGTFIDLSGLPSPQGQNHSKETSVVGRHTAGQDAGASTR